MNACYIILCMQKYTCQDRFVLRCRDHLCDWSIEICRSYLLSRSRVDLLSSSLWLRVVLSVTTFTDVEVLSLQAWTCMPISILSNVGCGQVVHTLIAKYLSARHSITGTPYACAYHLRVWCPLLFHYHVHALAWYAVVQGWQVVLEQLLLKGAGGQLHESANEWTLLMRRSGEWRQSVKAEFLFAWVNWAKVSYLELLHNTGARHSSALCVLLVNFACEEHCYGLSLWKLQPGQYICMLTCTWSRIPWTTNGLIDLHCGNCGVLFGIIVVMLWWLWGCLFTSIAVQVSFILIDRHDETQGGNPLLQMMSVLEWTPPQLDVQWVNYMILIFRPPCPVTLYTWVHVWIINAGIFLRGGKS